jgi:hypothetical protein
MRFSAEVREMAASELAGMISNEQLAAIRLKEDHPTFKAFCVGEVGEAAGRMLGYGNVKKTWYRSAISKLADAIRVGLKLFRGHQETNETMGRVAIGEVLAKRTMEIAGKFSAIVACWIYKDYADLPLDVASIEAGVDLQQEGDHGLYVTDVSGVTAIALGSSALETPGFFGARLLGQLEMMAHDHGFGTEGQVITPSTNMGALMSATAAKNLLGDRDSLDLGNNLILTRMVGGVVVNGKSFEEMTQEESNEARRLIEIQLGEKHEKEFAKYASPETNPFIRKVD